MMAKDPNQRHQSMSDVISAIERGRRSGSGSSLSGLLLIFGFLAVFAVCVIMGLILAMVYFYFIAQ
jgi:hypothetical protein